MLKMNTQYGGHVSPAIHQSVCSSTIFTYKTTEWTSGKFGSWSVSSI